MKLLMADYKNSNKLKFRPELWSYNVYEGIFCCFTITLSNILKRNIGKVLLTSKFNIYKEYLFVEYQTNSVIEIM